MKLQVRRMTRSEFQVWVCDPQSKIEPFEMREAVWEEWFRGDPSNSFHSEVSSVLNMCFGKSNLPRSSKKRVLVGLFVLPPISNALDPITVILFAISQISRSRGWKVGLEWIITWNHISEKVEYPSGLAWTTCTCLPTLQKPCFLPKCRMCIVFNLREPVYPPNSTYHDTKDAKNEVTYNLRFPNAHTRGEPLTGYCAHTYHFWPCHCCLESEKDNRNTIT